MLFWVHPIQVGKVWFQANIFIPWQILVSRISVDVSNNESVNEDVGRWSCSGVEQSGGRCCTGGGLGVDDWTVDIDFDFW